MREQGAKEELWAYEGEGKRVVVKTTQRGVL